MRARLRRWTCLGVLVAIHVGNNALFDAGPPQYTYVFVVNLGVLFSQSLVLAIWAALSQGSMAVRVFGAIWIQTALSLLPHCMRPDDSNIHYSAVWTTAVVMLLGATGVLAVVRSKLGWQLECTASTEAKLAARRRKLSIQDLLWITALAAAALATVRISLNASDFVDYRSLIELAILGMVVGPGVAFLALPWMRLVLGRSDRRTVFPMAIGGVIAGYLAVFIFTRTSVHTLAFESFALTAGYVCSLLVSLGLFRAAGYRLRRASDPSTDDSVTSGPVVSTVELHA